MIWTVITEITSHSSTWWPHWKTRMVWPLLFPDILLSAMELMNRQYRISCNLYICCINDAWVHKMFCFLEHKHGSLPNLSKKKKEPTLFYERSNIFLLTFALTMLKISLSMGSVSLWTSWQHTWGTQAHYSKQNDVHEVNGTNAGWP